MKDYLAVSGRFQHEIIVNRSRFIATVGYVNNYDEALAFISEIKKTYSTATHNCYAFISNELGTEQKFSDDGEPQGTAGQPILEVLRKKGLCCTAAVVTRYFGGVKLGAGGLVSAYTKVVAEAIDNMTTARYIYCKIFNIECDYENYNLLQQAFKTIKYIQLNASFDNKVKLTVAIPELSCDEYTSLINNTLSGNVRISVIDSAYQKFEF